MRTNNFFILIVLFALLYNTTACNDDEFLKEESETSYTYGNMFTVSSQINNLIAEMYYYHKENVLYPDGSDQFLYGIGTDVFDVRPNGTLVSDFSDWSTTYGRTQNAFNNLYTLIAKVNLVIFGAEQVSWSNESDKAYVVAQARFMRGYAYMILAELWGGVPISEEFFEAPKLDFARASREDTYLYAIGEMEAALAALPDVPEAGRVGKSAANHYLAECYIALAIIKGNDATLLNKAIAAADAVISRHPLMKERFGSRADPSSSDVMNGINAYTPEGNVYYDLFLRGNPNSPENTETLWVFHNNLAMYIERRSSYGVASNVSNFTPNVRDALWKTEYIQEGINGNSPWNGSSVPSDRWGNPGNNAAYTGGSGYGYCLPTQLSKNIVWERSGEGDMRNEEINIRRNFPVYNQGRTKFPAFGETINTEEASEYLTASTLIYCFPVFSKLAPVDDWGWPTLEAGFRRERITHDYYIARSAETYLLRAEARLRKGDVAGAADDINEVRGRAHAKLISASEATLDYILDERVRELYAEERRWCTLLRMGGKIPNDRITTYSLASEYQGGSSPWTHWKGTLADDFLLPIPQQTIDSNLNGVIEQNPMWK
jgi:hypothetical protein